MDCKTESLCLFDEKDVQLDITGNVMTDYHPTSSLSSGGPIEFNVPGTIDEYVDLSDTQLLVRVKITKPDGKPLTAAADTVAFVNQPISSLFQDVFLTIADKQVEGGQHCYPYNAYISSILQFHPSAKKTHMECWGFQEDEPGKMDDADNNDGFKLRRAETDVSQEWELLGPLFLDMTRQSRYILPLTDIRFKLLLAKPEFALHSTADTAYKYEITKAVLYVRRMRVKPAVINGHSKGLTTQNAKYPVNHVDITTFTITKGSRNYIKDHMYPSQTPKMLIVGLLDHVAFNGNIKKNPFNFQHYNVDKIGLYRDGELVPGQIYTPDFDKGFVRLPYARLMQVLNYFNTDDSNGMTLEHFEKGYTLFGFDLTPDAQCTAPYRSIQQSSSLRLELNFAKALPETITVMLFGVFDSRAEITALRDVIVSYNR